ncbi:hypothetical protein FB45DRAFT_1036729 [Roridomyces roridus]|uniref:Uncharacterized protein n=1 Tax=Roridomyces roridus TaxID=1738132 RepID=A0AAD7FD93_9AGAR|nr:hypothetical protein FB45DRAFT_1036729 [Roridomyces roridus]
MASPSTVIVLGPSPEAFFVGHGRRYFVENMPSSSFTGHATSALNIAATLWTSMNGSGMVWVNYNVGSDKFHFNGDINEDIRKHLTSGARFISFPDSPDPGHYFLKGKNSGAWNAVLPSYYVDRLTTMQKELKNFDVGITGMLFGQGTTNIVMFQAGFVADLDDKYVGEDHPLLKVLKEFSEPGWCIEYGSTLCFYDSGYFYLKFKRSGSSEVQMRWRLPPAVMEKLQTLREQAETPAEQIAITVDSQQQIMLAQARMNVAMAQSQALANVINYGAGRVYY